MIDKIKGCIYGFILGDTLGLPVKHNTKKEILDIYNKPIDSFVKYRHLPIGSYSSEAQLMLHTLESIVNSFYNNGMQFIKNKLLIDILTSYKKWLGTQSNPIYKIEPDYETLLALSKNQVGTIKSPINNNISFNNLIKILPIGLVLKKEDAFVLSMEVTAMTHGNNYSMLLGGFFAYILSCFLKNNDIDKSIKEGFCVLNKNIVGKDLCYKLNNGIQMNSNFIKDEQIELLLGEGWTCKEGGPLALYFISKYIDDFQKGLISTVNINGNSNTISAITCSFIGLNVGYNNLNQNLIKNLQNFDYINTIVERFCQVYSLISKKQVNLY